MKKAAKNDFIPAKQHAVLTTSEVVKMLRELKGWTQEELARSWALQLAVAFGVHPAIIMFPEYESEAIGKAA
jgi:hypothetical protein